MEKLKFKGIILLLFILLLIAWMIFVTYCIAQGEYAGALISISTMVITIALVVPVMFK